MMRIRTLVAICAVALAIPFSAGSAAAEDAAGMSAKELWSKKCASCHGIDGKGATKMGKKLHVEDMTSAEVKAGFDRDDMIVATRDGVKNEEGKQVMKPFADKLTEEEIGKLVDYILGGFSG